MSDPRFTPEELLDHVYGLLDDERAATLERELARSADLSAALERARTEAGVLADAAKLEAGDLRFTPLSEAAPARGRLLAWPRVLAAAVVLAFVAIGVDQFRARKELLEENPVLLVADELVEAPVGEPLSVVARLQTSDGDPLQRRVRAELHRGGQAPMELDTLAAEDGTIHVSLPSDAPEGISVCRIQDERTNRELAELLVVRTPAALTARVTTDKPIYRPGEPVRIRAVALDRVELKPRNDVSMIVRLEAPSGETIARQRLDAERGVAGHVVTLPTDASGGLYRVVLSHLSNAFPETSQRFNVADYREPSFDVDLELDRDSYRPGVEGRALFALKRATGEIPVGASIDATMLVGGTATWSHTYTLAEDGLLAMPFTVPDGAKGGCFLSFVVNDGAAVETVTKTVPLQSDCVIVDLFPEGGVLVAGLENRVYYRARDFHGKPTDLDALLLDASGHRLTATRVETEGMGSFVLTPELGENYRLLARGQRLDIEQSTLTPVASGVVMRSLGESDDGALRFRVAATEPGVHRIVATCRTAPLAETELRLEANTFAECRLVPTRPLGGVVRVTVFDPTGTPRAERLVARTPPHRLDVAVMPGKASYAPREAVDVDVAARDENGEPVAGALLGVTCVDRALRTLEQDTSKPTFASHFLLELGAEELERASHVEFGSESERTVDLLLAVRGWRRFVDEPQPTASYFVPTSHDVADVIAAERDELDRRAWVSLAVLLLGAGFVGLFLSRRAPTTPLARGAFACALIAGLSMFATVPARSPRPTPADSSHLVALVKELYGKEGDPGLYLEVYGQNWRSTVAKGIDGNLGDQLKSIGFDVRGLGNEKGPLVEFPTFVNGFFFNRITVREFARRTSSDPSTARQDFTDVLYWNPLLITDEDGTASFSFQTSDRLTTFAISVDAHDGRGALGTGESSFANDAPFSVDLTIPTEMATGDVASIALLIARRESEKTLPFTCDLQSPPSLVSVGKIDDIALLAKQARMRQYLTFRAVQPTPEAQLRLVGRLGADQDAIVRRLRIVPRGYPVTESRAGTLEGSTRREVVIPKAGVAKLEADLRLYPSTLATLSEGLDSMLREPGGCFEQVSSTTYPNAMILSWLTEQDAATPAVTRRAKDLLGKGLRLMAGHECKSGGFEWFGNDPGHETLTAYGLMELNDIAAVHPVDPALIDRTRRWLVDRRDGEGGFTLAEGKYGFRTSVVPAATSHAYILWALTSTPAGEGEASLAPELARLEETARTSEDPYVLALAANTFANAGVDMAPDLRDRLAGFAMADGSFRCPTTSITASGGRNLSVETTALATLALVDDARHQDVVKNAVDYLASARRGGGTFGATQATVLALKALVAYAKKNVDEPKDRFVVVRVNDRDVETIKIAMDARGSIAAVGPLAAAFVPGVNRVELRTDDGGRLPWSMTIAYHATTPPSSIDAPIAVTTQLASPKVREGDTVRVDVAVTNRRDAKVAMTIARIGLPAGLEPRLDQLKELAEREEVAFWETRPREITLYWRGMDAKETKRVALDLVAKTAGTYEGPATSAYLYYEDDAKSWADPLRAEIRTR